MFSALSALILFLYPLACPPLEYVQDQSLKSTSLLSQYPSSPLLPFSRAAAAVAASLFARSNFKAVDLSEHSSYMVDRLKVRLWKGCWTFSPSSRDSKRVRACRDRYI